LGSPRIHILGILEKKTVVTTDSDVLELQPGQFCVIPASVQTPKIVSEPGGSFLLIAPGA
jgi:hypothetical protein